MLLLPLAVRVRWWHYDVGSSAVGRCPTRGATVVYTPTSFPSNVVSLDRSSVAGLVASASVDVTMCAISPHLLGSIGGMSPRDLKSPYCSCNPSPA